jgi:diacylglycerol kinase (ATP)
MASTAGDPSAPLLVVNPRASRLREPDRRAATVRVVVRAIRDRTGQEPVVVDDTEEAASAALARLTASPLVAVLGGDGTIRHAADVLAGRSIPVAIVPAGTGNALAGSVGIRGLRSAVAAIRDGVPQTIDLGLAEWGRAGVEEPDGRRTFVVAAGVGLDARIMAAAHEDWKHRLRFGAYVGAALRELTRLRPAAFEITADGDRFHVDGHLALVANLGELIPGRFGPRERIDPTDGRLDLLVVGGRDLVTGLRSTAELLLRKGQLDGAALRRSVEEVRIETQPPQPVESDGDTHPPGWLAARVVPGALTILVPPTRQSV